MKAGRTAKKHGLIASLCIVLLLSSLPLRAVAQPPQANGSQANKAKITLTIGQPSIWSLAQAHYMLAKMRNIDEGIALTAPSLDPNSINGYRFDVLRQVFGAEGGFNGVAGAQNQVEMDRFRQDAARRQTARSRLDEALDQRQFLFTQLARVNRKLAAAEVEKEDLNAIPEKDRPTNFATQLGKVQAQIKDLKASQAALLAQKEEIDGQISAFENDAKNAVTAPTLKGVFGDSLSTGPAATGSGSALPDDITKIIDKVWEHPPHADLNASTKLDNHIQLQYEIIAKQLTLLRDEVGPDQRLVFLELPSSVYTVPGKSDNYLVQIKWNIKGYYGIDRTLLPTAQQQGQDSGELSDKTSSPITLELINRLEEQNGLKAMFLAFAKDKTDAEIDTLWQIRKLLQAIASLEAEANASATQGRSGDEQKQQQDRRAQRNKRRLDDLNNELGKKIDTYRQLRLDRSRPNYLDEQAIEREANSIRDEYEIFVQNPILSKMKWMNVKAQNREDDFRTVDVIPRQSTLNVNDTNASSTGFNLSAAFQWLTGIGAKVSYQRQREVYEEFVNQEIFAAGFGKGTNQFGWTFGPLPGTKCVAPGVKTTYAILVIPKDALVLTLHGEGISYRKKDSPDDSPIDLKGRDFRIVVPDEQTEGFWVNGITYTPVVQGERLSAILTGDYFSPQVGILVNGTPLRRVVSIGRPESGSSGTGVQGEYEYVSPSEIIMGFSMGSNYVGTPIITLVTPEKTSAINYFRDLRINFRPQRQSLVDASKQEPMFLHRLEVSAVGVKPTDDDEDSTLQLYGDGFRRNGELSINGVDIEANRIQMLSTGGYEVKLSKKAIKTISEASGDPAFTRRDSIQWKIRYKQHTRQGFEYAPVFEYTRPIVSDYDIVSFKRDAKTGVAQLVLRIAVPGHPKNVRAKVDDAVGTVAPPISDGGDFYRISITVNKDQDSFALTVTADDRPERVFDNIGLPDVPTIDKVVNMGTNKAEGPSDTEHDVQITGSHLKRVVQVMFNTTPGRIIQGDSDNVLIVKTPKLDGPTRVLVRTDLTLKGRPLTNISDLGTDDKARYVFKKAETSEAESGEAGAGQSASKKKASKKSAGKKTVTGAGK